MLSGVVRLLVMVSLPIRVSTVPIKPLSRPAADMIWCSKVVTVVFPFVPVTPTL